MRGSTNRGGGCKDDFPEQIDDRVVAEIDRIGQISEETVHRPNPALRNSRVIHAKDCDPCNEDRAKQGGNNPEMQRGPTSRVDRQSDG